ncbi:macrophage mannose receptor 1-like [Chanos chanos]|uniref:Macrophage mannose receptor 1-like n=1 Tax=Chanos chanos TaxID=29144 RepID=A0A6J2VTJ7_CHACN|nr:macrophage mannose receptor 1-like [Chanos chanos]
MTHIMHFILILSGLFMLSACVPHQYHFVNVKKTWTEAQTYCREHYTDLVTIDNQEDTEELIKTVKGDVERVWIGLEKSGDMRWQWSLGDPAVYREGEMGFTNWNQGEPNNFLGGSEDCGEMTDNGRWNDETCSVKRSSVCYDENKKNSERYIFVSEKKTWREAQRYCREKHTDLVSVRNKTENEKIKTHIKRTFLTWFIKNAVWTGLFRDSWRWSDGSTSSFRNWASNQPQQRKNERCAVVWVTGKNSGKWGDLGCHVKRPFVCSDDKLILINKSLTWREALNYCREHHVDLVSVHSEKIQKWVMEVVEKASTIHVWLGLRYLCSFDVWYWVSGDFLCYQNWAPGNNTSGEEECGGVVKTGAIESGGNKRWVSSPETGRLNFICSNYDEN